MARIKFSEPPVFGIYFFNLLYPALRDLHSFPTRRSSDLARALRGLPACLLAPRFPLREVPALGGRRSEEHTSELQSLTNLVCRLLLEKKSERGGGFECLNLQRCLKQGRLVALF